MCPGISGCVLVSSGVPKWTRGCSCIVGYIWVYPGVPKCSWVCPGMPGYTQVYPGGPRHTWVCPVLSGHSQVYPGPLQEGEHRRKNILKEQKEHEDKQKAERPAAPRCCAVGEQEASEALRRGPCGKTYLGNPIHIRGRPPTTPKSGRTPPNKNLAKSAGFP